MWKVQLTIAINFISSKDADEESVMFSKSNNAELMTSDHVNDIVDKLFKPLLSSYQSDLETSLRRSDFIFNLVQLLYCKCHKKYLDVVDHILSLLKG